MKKQIFFTLALITLSNCCTLHAISDEAYWALTALIQQNKAPDDWSVFFDLPDSYLYLITEKDRLNLIDRSGNNYLLGYIKKGLQVRDIYKLSGTNDHYLLKCCNAGINFNRQDNDLKTALMLLAEDKDYKGSSESLKTHIRANINSLLSSKANACLKDKDGNTAHMLALRAGNFELFQISAKEAPQALGAKNLKEETVAEFLIDYLETTSLSGTEKLNLFYSVVQKMVQQQNSPSLSSIELKSKKFVKAYMKWAVYAGVQPTQNDIDAQKTCLPNAKLLTLFKQYYEKKSEYISLSKQDTESQFIWICLFQNHSQGIEFILKDPTQTYRNVLDVCCKYLLTEPLDTILKTFNPSPDFKEQCVDLVEGRYHENLRAQRTVLFLRKLLPCCISEKVIKTYQPLQGEELETFKFCTEMHGKQDKDAFAKTFIAKIQQRLKSEKQPLLPSTTTPTVYYGS